MAQQNRGWDFDMEEGLLDTARLTRVVTDPMQPLAFKVERDTSFRDTVVDAADRQFRLHAGPADHGCRRLRRHSGAHAGALRREVEILGFTTRPGRVARRARRGWRPANRPSPPAERPAAHRLQGGRCPLAAGTAQPRG